MRTDQALAGALEERRVTTKSYDEMETKELEDLRRAKAADEDWTAVDEITSTLTCRDADGETFERAE